MSNKQDTEGLDHELLKEEEEVEWWRPTQRDNFNLTTKLLRVGCRPIKRKYLGCVRSGNDDYESCADLKEDMDKCVKMLKYIYATKSD